jgi:aspartyl aminopeptidase
LVDLIASDLGINADTIQNLDLYMADSNPACYFGLNDEFISSPRLDNLCSSFHSLNALMETENTGKYINMVASNIIIQALERIFKLLSGDLKIPDAFEKMVQKSFVISADMAHGLHPNYSEKHQSNHRTEINKGVILKTNVGQSYATDSVSASIVRILAEKVNVPVQDFIVRNDSPCGTTIGTTLKYLGPIISGKTGIKTVDIGAPMLGMHSIRETCGVLDGLYYSNLFKSFFANYESINHDLLKG